MPVIMELNSAGIFRKRYSRRRSKVCDRPALSDGKGTDTTEVNSSQTEGATAPAGNSSKTSEGKGSALSGDTQAVEERSRCTRRQPFVGGLWDMGRDAAKREELAVGRDVAMRKGTKKVPNNEARLNAITVPDAEHVAKVQRKIDNAKIGLNRL